MLSGRLISPLGVTPRNDICDAWFLGCICLPRSGLNQIYCIVVVVVITPPLPLDGGTARTSIQVHAVNLIEIRLGVRWQPISNQS